MALAQCEQNREDNAQLQLLRNLPTKTRQENGLSQSYLQGLANIVGVACLISLTTKRHDSIRIRS